MIKIEGIGTFEATDYGLIAGQNSIYIPAFGRECRFLLEAYEGDANPSDFHDAIRRFIAMPQQTLTDASIHVFAYYTDIRKFEWSDAPDIPSAEQVWNFVRFGSDAIVSRRGDGDDRIYISLSCGCAWEIEHGLQLVFREGNLISKVGQIDGHVSNANAFADPALEDVVYVP